MAGVELCLRHKILPWRRIGGRVVLLTGPGGLPGMARFELEQRLGPIRLARATEERIQIALQRVGKPALVARAEARTPAPESCRDLDDARLRHALLGLCGVLLLGLIFAPVTLLAVLSFLAVMAALASTGLKIAAATAHLTAPPRAPDAPYPAGKVLPMISIMVPLFREDNIASHLLDRLQRLNYPRDRLDICLVTEAEDLITRSCLSRTTLPAWIRAIEVPRGHLKTKPRALNYALDFTRGDIIGIYDAEDAPAPDQLLTVARRFATVAPDVACLQGVLDFYNTRSNWLSRCFAIEYAAWFRILLPGLQRLGLVMPLGGTTLFLRRDVITQIGAWDAHNVTEDADLGVRLARHGYRTEMLPTVTEEEANARAWPWIRQRSRWLKGYAMTYLTHMRRPGALWRDLGPKRFFGVQLIFAGTLLSFLLAPVLWSFWLGLFGFGHPALELLPKPAMFTLTGLFLFSEVVNISLAATAVSRAGKSDLIKWAPSLHIYFLLAALASFKGVAEIFWRPYYWDKTAHGIFAPTDLPSPAPGPTAQPGQPAQLLRSASSLSRVTKA